jgi:hypothetical protein
MDRTSNLHDRTGDFHTFAQRIPTGFPVSSTELIFSVSNVLQKEVEAAEPAPNVSHMR